MQRSYHIKNSCAFPWMYDHNHWLSLIFSWYAVPMQFQPVSCAFAVLLTSVDTFTPGYGNPYVWLGGDACFCSGSEMMKFHSGCTGWFFFSHKDNSCSTCQVHYQVCEPAINTDSAATKCDLLPDAPVSLLLPNPIFYAITSRRHVLRWHLRVPL